MTKKYLIALDDGHGINTAGKRTPPLPEDLYIDGKLVRKKGEVIKENEFNEAVVKYLELALKRCGFDVLLVAPTDVDTPLSTRVQRANSANADAYISKHYNAIGGRWQTRAKGLVTIIHENSSKTTKVLAKNVHEQLWKLYKDDGSKDFGVRTDKDVSGFSLYVLSNTKMPAILTESGFMDNIEDAKKMLDPKFQKQIAESTCKGICKTFNVEYIQQADTTNKPNKTQPQKTDKKEDNEEVSTNTKFIRVLVDGLNIRKNPSWESSDVVGNVKKGEIFTIAKKVKVGNGFMYELKSGLYITASSKYVESLVKL